MADPTNNKTVPHFALSHFSRRLCVLQDEEDEAPKAVKTSFTVKLMKFDEKQKVPLIKEVKSLLEGMNLVQVCYLSPLHSHFQQ